MLQFWSRESFAHFHRGVHFPADAFHKGESTWLLFAENSPPQLLISKIQSPILVTNRFRRASRLRPAVDRFHLSRLRCSKLVPTQKGLSILLSRSVIGCTLRNLLKVQSGLDNRLSWICDVPKAASSWITCTIVPGIR
jgi:hypothetical protein